MSNCDNKEYNCAKCGKQLPPSAEFCPYCGTAAVNAALQPTEDVDTAAAESRCAKCGKQLPPNAEFCPYCGKVAAVNAALQPADNEEKIKIVLPKKLIPLFLAIFSFVVVWAIYGMQSVHTLGLVRVNLYECAGVASPVQATAVCLIVFAALSLVGIISFGILVCCKKIPEKMFTVLNYLLSVPYFIQILLTLIFMGVTNSKLSLGAGSGMIFNLVFNVMLAEITLCIAFCQQRAQKQKHV